MCHKYPDKVQNSCFPPSPKKQCSFYEKKRKQAYQIHFQPCRRVEEGFFNNFSRIFDLPGNFWHGLSIYRKKNLKGGHRKRKSRIKKLNKF